MLFLKPIAKNDKLHMEKLNKFFKLSKFFKLFGPLCDIRPYIYKILKEFRFS